MVACWHAHDDWWHGGMVAWWHGGTRTEVGGIGGTRISINTEISANMLYGGDLTPAKLLSRRPFVELTLGFFVAQQDAGRQLEKLG
jgi:hypothetical protein